MSLGELIQQIGNLIVSYERSQSMKIYEDDNSTRLLKNQRCY